MKNEQKVIVRCKDCDWRILDKVTPATGTIEVKCPRCGHINEIDLSLRRRLEHYRLYLQEHTIK